jgi:hypothetical protein
MKIVISIVALVLVGAVVAIAATTRTTPRSTGTQASLMNAYVAAAKYWQHQGASVKPPTTASLMNAYVEAARYWQHRLPSR